MTSPMNNQLAKGVDVRNTRLWHNDIARRVANLERQGGKLATPGGVKMYRADAKTQEAVTAKRIMVHWLGHTFAVDSTMVPGVGDELVWLAVTTVATAADQSSTQNWNKSVLEGAAVMGRGDEWPNEAHLLIFPLMELTADGIIYHRNYRVIDDDGTPTTIFDAVTVPDDPIGTVKLFRGPVGMPIGWENIMAVGDLTNRIFTTTSGTVIDEDTSHYLESTTSPPGNYRIRRMLYIQRVAVIDDP